MSQGATWLATFTRSTILRRYDGWNAKPPQYRDGTVIPDRADWRQRVSVTYVTPSNPTQTSATDQGAKRIHVTIEYQDVVLADQYAVFTNTEDK